MKHSDVDVIILGGGLAGLTLAIQLKQNREDLNIEILEMRPNSAPEAAHKVGESTVELGTHYIREVLDLKDYMDEHQLPKHGLRFFLSPQHKDCIEKRVEMGPREFLPVPSHQIDRGTFENELVDIAQKLDVQVTLGAKVSNIEFGESIHNVEYSKNKEDLSVSGRWIVDASGRAGLLKRKLDLAKEIDHNVNAAWFRVKGEIDVDTWSENQTWAEYLRPGLRRLSTVHLMDKGYWVWLIPLATGNTSVGIVADPQVHPFRSYNKIDKAFEWLKENEPQCYRQIKDRQADVLDFKVISHYALDAKQVYSSERWAITGESGVFLDPFYSPGTDFIALNNTFIADLILKDKADEDVEMHTTIYEKTLFAMFENWVPIYQNKYPLWGNTQTMVLKISWDWAIYWAVPTLLFTNDGFTNISVLGKLFSKEDSSGQKLKQLNTKMQEIFVEWAEYDTEQFSERYIDPFDIDYLKALQKGLDERYSARDLVQKVNDNYADLEAFACEIFRLMSQKIYGKPFDFKINPYTMTLAEEPQKDENGVVAGEIMRNDIAKMWFYETNPVVT